jgi:hypothetical protein
MIKKVGLLREKAVGGGRGKREGDEGRIRGHEKE